MSKRFKFTLSRTAIVAEIYQVEADSLDEAVEYLMDGNGEPVHTEWIDWYGSWEEDEREDLCPLTKMVKDYKVET